MFTPILDQLGDWNPQLLRELKGQLKWLKIGLAIALSLIVQIVFLVMMSGMLPGAFGPKSLQVTTFPKIQLDYNYEENDNFRISYLSGTPPLENHPGYGTLLSNPIDIQVGDRILAINGVSLGVKSDKQHWFDEQLEKPFTDDLKLLLPGNVLGEQGRERIAQQLRQEIPGQTVQLTIERGEKAAPITVDIPRVLVTHRTNTYCLPFEGKLWDGYQQERHYDQHSRTCNVNVGEQGYRIDWTRWHQEAFWTLSLVAIFPLFVLGSYSLIANLLKEEREGTFNFIRLSPQSAWEILFGKLLGVPSLIYGAVLLTLPLNLLHGLLGGLGVFSLLGFYVSTIILTFFFFSIALLIGMVPLGLGIVQAWLGAGAIGLIQFLCLQASRYVPAEEAGIFGWSLLFTPFSVFRILDHPPFVDQYGDTSALFIWFGIPLFQIVAVVLLVGNSIILSRWIWNALTRRFFSPTGTLLSKGQSYGLTLFVNLSMMGFCWIFPHPLASDPYKNYDHWMEGHFMGLSIANGALLILLLIALSPQRQSLYDWARYRHILPTSFSPSSSENSSKAKHSPAGGTEHDLRSPLSHSGQSSRSGPSYRPGKSLWYELVFGEKSPMVGAIALNLLIGGGCMLLWGCHHLLQQNHPALSFGLLLAIILSCINILLISATLTQFVFLFRDKHAMPTALLMLIVLSVGTPILLAVSGGDPYHYPGAWFALFPWVSVFEPVHSIGPVVLGLMAQWAMLAMLNRLLVQRFKTIGESDSKALLAANKGVS